MTDDDRIDALLAAAQADTAPLSDPLRTAILADAAAAEPPRRTWLAGLAAGLPAAAAGLWLGLAQPALVLQVVPGAVLQDSTEVAVLDEVFGTWEEDG